MKLYSVTQPDRTMNFVEAIERGIADGGGLTMPSGFRPFATGEIEAMAGMSLQEIALTVSLRFLEGEIGEADLQRVIGESLTFPIPLVRLDARTSILELFHGPTLAFKDVGAGFMARMLSHLRKNEDHELTILVATSGDTGSAVAHGFHGVEGIRVVLLYPAGKVSRIQEQQMTTLGGNVTALEIEGTFDDCQRLVKEAFADPGLSARRRLSSANSINIARLLPQTFYYFHAAAQLGRNSGPPVFAVPSGNLGNLTAGLFARALGLPVHRFIAASNANNVLPEFLMTGRFRPRPSVQTISNAMDVGDPSNFARIAALFGGDYAKITAAVSGASFSDDETRATIREVHEHYGYILDPHAAVAYRAWMNFAGGEEGKEQGIVLATAHPAKFAEVYDAAIAKTIDVPGRLSACLDLPAHSVKLPAHYDELKSFLINH